MCGILGYFARNQQDQTISLAAGNRMQAHRGPDGAGTWESADRRAGLGHVRLSIIDLETGAQPIVSEDGQRHLIVNGEFYDYEAIQQDLQKRGHHLSTKSDSEIALHLYEDEGIDCLNSLRGEFAFALWDDQEQRLFAARDRFGIKPFFYAIQDGVLYFASEIKALQAMGVRLVWDEESVAESLYSYVGSSRTYFRGVKQLPPGNYLIATRDGITIRPYWDLDYPVEEKGNPQRSDDEWIDLIRSEVSEAVRLRMRADVPVGCLLSGGLDSSSALGLARKWSGGALKTFTIAFDEATHDESAQAEATARAAGAEFLRIPVSNGDFASVFEDAVWHTEGFHYNNHGAARHLLSRAVRDAGIKTVLAGEGGDELTAGYLFCEKTLGLKGEVPAVSWPPEVLALLAGKSQASEIDEEQMAALTERSKVLGFPDSTFGFLTGRVAMGHRLIDEEFTRKVGGGDAMLQFFRQFDVAGKLSGRAPVRQALYLWLKTGFANYILGGERLDMAHGVEQRLPFLDHKLFELMRDIPINLMHRDGREKWVLREAMKPYVPTEVYAAKKQPFTAPGSSLSDGSPMLDLAQDLLRSEAAAALPFIDQAAVIALLDRLPQIEDRDRRVLDSSILMMMSAVVLQQRFKL